MEECQSEELAKFLLTLGYDEMPFGIFYSDTKPSEGITVDASDLPTREKEQKNEIDWQNLFSHFTCVIGAGRIPLGRSLHKSHRMAPQVPGKGSVEGGARRLGSLCPEVFQKRRAEFHRAL